MKTFIFTIGIALLVGLGVFTLHALPVPAPRPGAHSEAPEPAPLSPAPSPPQGGPTITWSVPQLTATLFPGTSSTAEVSFQSDQNLVAVVIEPTPSLSGMVSVSPANFPSIIANQNYTLTLTLSAPPAFQKRSFGGTIHVRNASTPPKTYATPLSVDLRTDFLLFTDSQFTITVPPTWVPASGSTAQLLPDGALRWIIFSLPNDPNPVLYIYVYPHGFSNFANYDEPPGFLGSNGQFDFYFHMRNAPADPTVLALLGLTDDQFHNDLLQALATFTTP